MVPFEPRIVGQDAVGREQHRCHPKGMRGWGKQDGREADTIAPKRFPGLQEQTPGMAVPQADHRRARHVPVCEGDNEMSPLRLELPDFLHHGSGQLVFAAPETHDHRFRILAEQSEYESSQSLVHR